MATLQSLHLDGIAMNFAQLCVWLALLALIFIPLERLCSVRPQRVFRKAMGNDVFYYFLSGLLPKLILVLPLSAIAWFAHRAVPSSYYQWAATFPLWMRVAAGMVVGEIGAYWAHRWSHEIPLLWRFHAIHHSAEEVDWLVHTRLHPVDMLFTRICALTPMYLLGLAQPISNGVDIAPYVVTIIGTTWGFFIHSNIKWRLGWFEWLISSPAFHHWHHTNDAGYVDKNYAPMLPWVDALFGTAYLPRGAWPVKYGTDTVIGDTLVEQLVDPFLITKTPLKDANCVSS